MVLVKIRTPVKSPALFHWSSWAMLQRSMMAASKTKAGEMLTEVKTRSLLMLAACPNRCYFEFLLLYLYLPLHLLPITSSECCGSCPRASA